MPKNFSRPDTGFTPLTPNSGKMPNAWRADTSKYLNTASSLMHSSRGTRAAVNAVTSVTKRIQRQEQNHVEQALQEKMSKSAGLRSALHHACERVQQQLEAVQAERERLVSLQAMKQQSLDLSLQRYSMRGARPRGENTADAVQSLLCKQQGQLQKSLKAIQSCLNECDNLTKQLMALRTSMEHDLRDKAHALELDARALSLDGRQATPITMPVGGATVPFRESTWGRKTSVLINDAKKVTLDTERLQRRVTLLQKDLESSEAEIMSDVQKTLKGRLGQTLEAASVLDKKLKQEYKELENAAKTKDKLMQAIEAKQQPMTLVQQRYSTRHMSRPGREAVHDEVEVALATEFSELNAMVREMSKKHRKLDNTIRQMNHSAQALEDTLREKRAAYDMDSQIYRMAAGWRPTVSHPAAR